MVDKRAEIVLSVVVRPALFAAYVLSGFFPRNPRLWAFGCWDGRRFADNTAALYRYCNEQPDSPVHAVWITRDTRIAAELSARCWSAHHAWSLRGLFTCMRAGVFVFDGHTKDINHWLSNGAKRVNLQHGVAGHKHIERNIRIPTHRLYKLFHGTRLQKLLWSYLVPWHRVRPDLVIAAARQQVGDDARAYGVGTERVLITGLPRNDVLASASNKIPINAELSEFIRSARQSNDLICLYMPTFRDGGQPAFPYSWEVWSRMLNEINAVFICHRHFADTSEGPGEKLPNVKFVEREIDLYPIFHHVDCLVTDYSSVAFDFMLTGKPIVYFVHDFDAYAESSRNLRCDFDSVAPGPKAGGLKELAVALGELTPEAGKPGQPNEEYLQVRNRFHEFRDGGASARVYRAIVDRFVGTDPTLN